MGAKSLSPNVSILAAKVWGMREGVKAALALGVDSIIIEGNNLVVINSLRKCWKVSWETDNFICDAGVDLASFSNVVFNHCFRKANRAADFLLHIRLFTDGMSLILLCPSLSSTRMC